MKKVGNKNPIVVYWAPHAVPEREGQQILLDIMPKSLLGEIKNKKSNNPNTPHNESGFFGGSKYHACSALHELTNNVYVIKAPFSIDLELDQNGAVIRNKKLASWFMDRSGSFENCFSVDFDMGYNIFCEEPLEVSITPPYMQQTKQSEYGFIASVKWDISSWYRPFGVIFHLWEGKNKVNFDQGDPIAYLHFHTDRPLIFKEYRYTQELMNMSLACANHKFIIPFQGMQKLYNRFQKSGMKKIIVQEIKKNLIN